MIGDSITEDGWYVKELERLLKESGIKSSFEVWNCGVGGYGIKNYWAYIKHKAMVYSPDMVIIGFCLNDFDYYTVVMPVDENGKLGIYDNMDLRTEKINQRLFLTSNLYRYYLAMRGKLRKVKDWGREDPGNSEWAFKSIAEHLNEKQIPLKAIIFPYLKSTYNNHEKQQYEHIKRVMAKYGIDHVDLHNAYKNIDDIKWRNNTGDFIHPSKKGHLLAGQKLYEALIGNIDSWYKK